MTTCMCVLRYITYAEAIAVTGIGRRVKYRPRIRDESRYLKL